MSLVDLIRMELRDAYRFPLLEVFVFFVGYILFSSEVGGTLSPLILVKVSASLILMNTTNIASVVIPVLVSYRVAGAIEYMEASTILLLPILKEEYFFSKILVNSLVPMTIITSLALMSGYLQAGMYFMRYGFLILALALIVNMLVVVFITATVTMVTTYITKRVVPSIVITIFIWLLIRFAVAERILPYPYTYVFPPLIGGLIYMLLSGDTKTYGPIQLDANEVPVFEVLSITAILSILCVLISYLVIKAMEVD